MFDVTYADFKVCQDNLGMRVGGNIGFMNCNDQRWKGAFVD